MAAVYSYGASSGARDALASCTAFEASNVTVEMYSIGPQPATAIRQSSATLRVIIVPRDTLTRPHQDRERLPCSHRVNPTSTMAMATPVDVAASAQPSLPSPRLSAWPAWYSS